jgi:pyridoxal biosynthesis lyase PdxS
MAGKSSTRPTAKKKRKKLLIMSFAAGGVRTPRKELT